jgi:hypothetical protein
VSFVDGFSLRLAGRKLPLSRSVKLISPAWSLLPVFSFASGDVLGTNL